MGLNIDLGAWNSVFAVPAVVVDEHIKMAGSAQLKVLLYVLRHSGENLECEQVSKAVGLAQADITDAMNYWLETGILSYSGEKLVPVQAQPAPAQEPEPIKPEPEEKKKSFVSSQPTRPNHAECAQLLENEEIRQLVSQTQMLFGNMLKRSDIDILVSIPTWTGLPVSVVLMIVTYCCSIGKKSVRYIEKVAVSWSEKEIDTLEKADKFIADITSADIAWKKVRSVLGIPERRASEKEKEYCTKWVQDWNFSSEMIRESYDRCVNSTGKVSFAYMNKILERWKNDGVYTKKDIADLEKSSAAPSGKDAKHRKRKTSYDINDLERKLNDDTISDWGESD